MSHKSVVLKVGLRTHSQVLCQILFTENIVLCHLEAWIAYLQSGIICSVFALLPASEVLFFFNTATTVKI